MECVEGNLGPDREQCERVLAGWVQSVERLSAAGFEFPDYLPRERGMFGWRWKVPEIFRERGLDREFKEFVEGVDLDRMYEIDSEMEVRAEHAFSHALASLGHTGRANFRLEGNAEVTRGHTHWSLMKKAGNLHIWTNRKTKEGGESGQR